MRSANFLALHKPNILIPLSAAASRGDQILNARSFEKQGFSYVIEEETLTVDILLEAIGKSMQTGKIIDRQWRRAIRWILSRRSYSSLRVKPANNKKCEKSLL